MDSTDKEDRLSKRRELEGDRRASETVEQRKEWLRVRREQDRTRRAARSKKNEKLHYSGCAFTAEAE